jgi:Fic family protein
MEPYILEKPDLQNKEQIAAVAKIYEKGFNPFDIVAKANQPKYLYWDRLKYKVPSKDISAIDYWLTVKWIRKAQAIRSPIVDVTGAFFSWNKLAKLEKFTHQLDLNTGGNLFAFQKDMGEKHKQRLISKGILEEAIASSQLEGANTTRRVAKEMIREGRRPINKSEHMILNNYLTMQAVEEEYKSRDLDMEMLLELHAMITKDTVPEDEQGRLRKSKEQIVVSDDSGIIYHAAPDIKFTRKQLKRLFHFANKNDDDPFIHPVIKAIMIHFWLAYLHPFTDGNGRLARLLFYWYLIKNDYWAFVYLPISKIIKRSPSQYKMSYVYSEQDDFDLTYFIDYNVRKVESALHEFEQYVYEKAQKNSLMNRIVKTSLKLNDRQIQLLQFFYGDPDSYTSTKVHQNIHNISKKTAELDLNHLINYGFVTRVQEGRSVKYFPTDKIKSLF